MNEEVEVPCIDGGEPARFRELADWWHSDTDMMSDVAEVLDHRAYKTILTELGRQAIPFILRDLRDRGGHWFMALSALVPDPPLLIPQGMQQARTAWLTWGHAKGII